MEEAQVLAVFETFFFSPALKLLVWVFETFQEVVSNRWEFEMKENKVGFGSTLRVCVLLFARFNFNFFFQAAIFDYSPMNSTPMHCSRVSQTSLFSHFFIKNGFHCTIHTFKNYFATLFLIFSFSKISSIQTDSKSGEVIGHWGWSGVRWKGGFLVYKYPINVCLFTKIPKLEF